MAAQRPYVARALAKNVLLSPQKGRLVADMIRGLPVGEAVERLNFCRQRAGRLLVKVLNSAIANAEENHNADIDALRIQRVEVSDGVSFARVRFGARGRIHRIMRRRSHILLELKEGAARGKRGKRK